MKRVIIAVICMVLTLSLSGRPAESSDETDLGFLRASEACQAAEREPDFGDVIDISATLRNLIIEYRKGWRKLCSGAWEGTIYPLYQQAKEIEKKFSSVIEETERVHRTMRRHGKWEAAYNNEKKMNSMLRSHYPSFVPSFKGGWIYFKASLSGFQKYAPFGDAEDSLFFRDYFELRGKSKFLPWILGTWDYGGCFRFGEYQWVDALNKIDFLKKKLTKSLYREVVLGFEKDLKDFIKDLSVRAENGWPICTCENKDAVHKDLRDMLENIKDWPEYEKAASILRKVLDAIDRNEVEIRSESEKHCSGS